MSRRLEWGAAVGIGLNASALGALGAPTPVWVVILIIGVGLLAHALVGGLPKRIETPTDITAKVVPRSSQRRVLPDSAFDLQRPFRDLTTVEAEQQTSLYIGAWVKATGFVAEPVEVAPDRSQNLALARRPNTAPVVYVFFALDETKRESKPGGRISVEGKVTEVGPWRVVLTECHVL